MVQAYVKHTSTTIYLFERPFNISLTSQKPFRFHLLSFFVPLKFLTRVSSAVTTHFLRFHLNDPRDQRMKMNFISCSGDFRRRQVHLITSLHTWGIRLASTAAAHFKNFNMTWEVAWSREEPAWKQMYHDTNNFRLQFGSAFFVPLDAEMIVPVAKPQLVCFSFMLSLTCLGHKIDVVYCITESNTYF